MREMIEALRLIHNLIRVGTVAEINYETARCRVTIGELKTTWLPWLSTRAGNSNEWNPPSLSEQVVVLAPGGNLSAGLVLMGLYQTRFSAPSNDKNHWLKKYPDGAKVEYHHQNSVANITLPAGAVVNLVSTGGVNITGDVAVDGHISATGHVSDGVRSMAADRDI